MGPLTAAIKFSTKDYLPEIEKIPDPEKGPSTYIPETTGIGLRRRK